MYSDEIICSELKRISALLQNVVQLLSASREGVNLGDDKKLMTSAEAATYLGINKNTLTVWRCTQRYRLPSIKVGRSVRYRRSDLDEWLANR